MGPAALEAPTGAGAIFHGPQLCIRPLGSHASKASDGRVQPTWNCAAVHRVHRQPGAFTDDADWVAAQIEAIPDGHAGGQARYRSVGEIAPAGFD